MNLGIIGCSAIGTDVAIAADKMDEIKKIGADCYIAKGPFKKMADHLNRVLDNIEGGFSRDKGNENVVEPEKVYPR